MAKRCNHPSCYIIVRDGTGRCEKHTTSKKKENYIARCNNDNQETRKIYNSQRWRRISKKIRSIRVFCEICLSRGQEVTGVLVDHIKELYDGGEPYNPDNLMCLCASCHAIKTADAKRTRNITRNCIHI